MIEKREATGRNLSLFPRWMTGSFCFSASALLTQMLPNTILDRQLVCMSQFLRTKRKAGLAFNLDNH